MPIKPERQNPFWPAVPKVRRSPARLIAIVVFVVVVLIVARFAARILLG